MAQTVLKHNNWGETDEAGEEISHLLSPTCWCEPRLVVLDEAGKEVGSFP